MSAQLRQIHNMLQSNEDCTIILKEVEQIPLSQKEMKSFISLQLRYFIKNKMFDRMEVLLSTNSMLMKRDYWACIEVYINANNINKAIEIMNRYIKMIETDDVDLMIKNKWFELIKHWDGFPVETSKKPNLLDTGIFVKYNYDVSLMALAYKNKISQSFRLHYDKILEHCDVLIDGANISHVKSTFNYSILMQVIKMLEGLHLRPVVIIHERHKIDDVNLARYIVRTPRNNYDDNYFLYGMLQYNKLVVSNDTFRDHIIGMSEIDRLKHICFFDMMTIKYVDSMLVIPTYSKCIQVINDSIYIPSSDKYYKCS